jgi:hypothetical protein
MQSFSTCPALKRCKWCHARTILQSQGNNRRPYHSDCRSTTQTDEVSVQQSVKLLFTTVIQQTSTATPSWGVLTARNEAFGAYAAKTTQIGASTSPYVASLRRAINCGVTSAKAAELWPLTGCLLKPAVFATRAGALLMEPEITPIVLNGCEMAIMILMEAVSPENVTGHSENTEIRCRD